IRVLTRSLLEANEGSVVHLSTCNTGASWVGEGKKSQRGIDVFQRDETFAEPPEKIQEAAFRVSVNHPEDSGWSTGIGQRWRALVGQTNGHPQSPSKKRSMVTLPTEKFARRFHSLRCAAGDRLAFLSLSGSLSPVHTQHMRALEAARNALTRGGW